MTAQECLNQATRSLLTLRANVMVSDGRPSAEDIAASIDQIVAMVASAAEVIDREQSAKVDPLAGRPVPGQFQPNPAFAPGQPITATHERAIAAQPDPHLTTTVPDEDDRESDDEQIDESLRDA